MTSWITSFFPSTQGSSLIATDGRNSTSLLQLPEDGAGDQLTLRPRQEKTRLVEEDEEEARPPYLHVCGKMSWATRSF